MGKLGLTWSHTVDSLVLNISFGALYLTFIFVGMRDNVRFFFQPLILNFPPGSPSGFSVSVTKEYPKISGQSVGVEIFF